jgi:arginase
VKAVDIVGVPMDLGGFRRGVDMGPSAIRYAGLRRTLADLGYRVRDRGNVRVADRDESAEVEYAHGGRQAHHSDEIVRAAEELAKIVTEIVKSGSMPIVLGGDHSIGMGTIAGLARAGHRAGVLWVDAHGDINTPDTTPSGNVHGMPLAVALGIADEPFPKALQGNADGKNAVLLAIRDIDTGEKDNIKRAGVTAITMSDIDRIGMARAMENALAVASRGDGIHLSLDMDAIDPDEAPGVGTPVRGGLTYREAQLAMEMVHASGMLRSVEVCEVNPILDRENRTANLAVELIASALGQTIL